MAVVCSSWVGGTLGRPFGEIQEETAEPVGAEIALTKGLGLLRAQSTELKSWGVYTL